MNNVISLLFFIGFFIANASPIFSCALIASLEKTIKTDLGLNDARFSPHWTKLLLVTFKKASIRDVASGSVDLTFLHDEEVVSARYSLDGTKVVTASKDKSAKIWDAASGKRLQTLKHQGEVLSANFSPDGNRIVTTSVIRDPAIKWSKAHVIKIWDINGEELKTITGDYGYYPMAAIFSKDGTKIIVAEATSNKIFDAGSDALVEEFGRGVEGHKNTVNSVGLSPDGNKIVTASVDKTAKVWDLATFSLLNTLKPDGVDVLSAEFSRDGGMVVTANFQNAQIWDARNGALLATITGNIKRINSAVFNDDGTKVLLAGIGDLGAGMVEIWHLLPK